MVGSFRSPTRYISFNSDISADDVKATADVRVTVDGRDYTLTIEGSHTSIFVDINALQHVVLNAYVRKIIATHFVIPLSHNYIREPLDR